MTIVTALQRSICRNAATAGLPFALWRDPEGSSFTLIASTEPPAETHVFNGVRTPAFVMAPFAEADGNLAWHICADILVNADQARYRSGTSFVRRPVNSLQEELVKGNDKCTLQIKQTTAVLPGPVTRSEYEARVARAVQAIKAGTCDKIVLSRAEARELPAGKDLIDILNDLAAAHPHAFVSLVSSGVTGTWLTATPEILLDCDDKEIRTMALAGTQWPPEGSDPDQLEWSDKIVEEQGLVARYIRAAFAAEEFSAVTETAPHTVQAANLCHLRSDFTAPMGKADAMAGLLRRLHPTSAVCGMPKEKARSHILKEEGDTRSFYTGYLGPVRVRGKTTLYVNLRSARYTDGQLFLHVGGGIVAGSDPALEWEETVQKTKTIAQVL